MLHHQEPTMPLPFFPKLTGGKSEAAPRPTSFTFAPPTPPRTSQSDFTLPPKLAVPAIPHPSPYRRLAVIATEDGLLIRPELPNHLQSRSYVRIPWGKAGIAQEVFGDADWEGTPIYGIIGILKLYHGLNDVLLCNHALIELCCLCLSVIPACDCLSNRYRRLYVQCRLRLFDLTSPKFAIVFDPSRPVYCIKDATAIPLEEASAIVMLNALATQLAKQRAKAEAAPHPGPHDDPATPNVNPVNEQDFNAAHVRFASKAETIPIPPAPPSAFYAPSVSPAGAAPAFRNLAAKLSFWAKPKSAASLGPTASDQQSISTVDSMDDLMPDLDDPTGDTSQPDAVLDRLINASAAPPATMEEKHSQLDAKVVRECLREFSKGGMYFSYDFGTQNSFKM